MNYNVVTLDQLKDGIFKINTPLYEINLLISILKKEVKKEVADFEILQRTCEDLIWKFPAVIHIYKDTFMIRSRPNFNGEIFSTVTEVSYNKEKPHLIELGRFNLKQDAVFYASVPISSDFTDGSVTTIVESYKALMDENNDEPQQILTLGKWISKKPINLFLLTFLPMAWKKSIHLQYFNLSFIEILTRCESTLDKGKLITFYKFFSEIAGLKTDSENNYLLTTAFFSALKKVYGNEIGILYSSSMTENYGLSIVLTKDIIDKNYLELNEVVMYKGIRNPKERTNFKIFPFMQGFNINGSFSCTELIVPKVPNQFFSIQNAIVLAQKYLPIVIGRKVNVNNTKLEIVSLRLNPQKEGCQLKVIFDNRMEERLEQVLSLLYMQDDTFFDNYLSHRIGKT